MKRLLALLLLLSSAALNAQQLDWTNAVNVPNIVVNPSMDNCVSGAPTCGAWKETGFPLGNWVGANSNGGALDPGGKQYTFSYLSGTLYQDIDLSVYETNLFNFTFLFDLNNSCRNFIGGACDRIDGPIDPFSVTLKFYDTNGLNNSFTFLSGNPSTATTGCIGGVELLGLCLLGQNVQDNWQTFGWYSHVQSNFLFTSARLEFTGNDAGFWGGLYGPSVDNAMLQINYMPPPLPTSGGLAGPGLPPEPQPVERGQRLANGHGDAGGARSGDGRHHYPCGRYGGGWDHAFRGLSGHGPDAEYLHHHPRL